MVVCLACLAYFYISKLRETVQISCFNVDVKTLKMLNGQIVSAFGGRFELQRAVHEKLSVCRDMSSLG